MKPIVPPSIEPLEPRLLLSVTFTMLEAPLDLQSSPDNAVVVEQEPQAGVLSSGGSLEMSVGVIDSVVIIGTGDPATDEPTEEHWAPYMPTAGQTAISIRTEGTSHIATVTLFFPDSGYQVRNWGTLSHEANRFWVDTEVEQWTGTSENVVTAISHDYDLGALIDNDNCVFSFNTWQQLIESKWFVAGTAYKWLPSLLDSRQTGIAVIKDGANTKVRVTIQFPTGGYRMENWGAVQQQGNTFVVNVEPEAVHGRIVTMAFVTVTHEYDLGEVPDDNYLFEIRAWDQFAVATGFSPATALKPVYRFWSPTHARHFYTIDEVERDKLINQYSHFWTFEGVAYYAYAGDTQPDTSPVYRFWSPVLGSHFYTINEGERDWLIENHSNAWTYEGVAFYAYTQEAAPAGMHRVCRFWSGQSHFFTADDAEENKIRTEWSHVWTPEAIAWYTCGL